MGPGVVLKYMMGLGMANIADAGSGACACHIDNPRKKDVAVRARQPCASPLMADLGSKATCRETFGVYNTGAKVDRLLYVRELADNLVARCPSNERGQLTSTGDAPMKLRSSICFTRKSATFAREMIPLRHSDGSRSTL